MKVAIAQWRGRVSPVFDVAEQMLVLDVDNPMESAIVESLSRLSPHHRVQRLKELEIQVLICGALTRPLQWMLADAGVRIIPFVCGDVGEVFAAFRAGTLGDGCFAMPGCCHKRRRGRGSGNCNRNADASKERL